MPNGWRRAKAMLHNDPNGELRRRFLLDLRPAQPQHRSCASARWSRSPRAATPRRFDEAIEIVGTWPREERREGARTLLQALAERRIGRRDQAQAWLWRLAEYSRDVHEEYAVAALARDQAPARAAGQLVGPGPRPQRPPLVHASRKQDRRLAAALLAASVAHTPEGEEVLRGARNRMARKPSALARELVRNFPKGKRRASAARRRR